MIEILKAEQLRLEKKLIVIKELLRLYGDSVQQRADDEQIQKLTQLGNASKALRTCKNPECTNLFESIDNEEYCGKKCKAAHKPVKKEREKKICQNCKKEFIPKASAQKYCSKECKPYKISKRKELNATLKEIEKRRKQPYPLTSN